MGSIIAPIAGGLISSAAAGSAADAQTAAANNGIQLQKQIFDTINNQLQPYRSIGYGATNQLASLMGIPVDANTLQTELAPQYGVTGNITAVGGTPAGHGKTAAPAGGYTYKDAAGNLITDSSGNVITTKSAPKAGTPLTADWLSKQSGKTGLTDWTALQAALTNEQKNLNSSPSYGSLTKPFTLADFQADPGYKFTLQQGEQGIDRAMASRGSYDSGAALKALGKYDTGLANQTFGDAFARNNTYQNNLYNRLSGVSNQGMGAVNDSGKAGQNYANQASNLYNQIGNVQGAAGLAQAGIMNQGLAGLMGSSYGGGSNWGSGGSWDPLGLMMKNSGSW